MTDDMKAWQHGFDIGYLNDIEARFAYWNAYARGPFSEMNPAKIARSLNDRSMAIFPWGVIVTTFPRHDTPIKAYLDVVIGNKHNGDRVIEAMSWEEDGRSKLLAYLASRYEPTWLWIWQESAEMRAIAEEAGYQFVGGKISSMAEIKGLWFRDGDAGLFGRDKVWSRHFPELDTVEYLGIVKANIKISPYVLCDAIGEVKQLQHEYTNHYSNYSKRKSWSALSLRGYSSDPGFIAKPAEMSKKWWAEHRDDVFVLQDTELRTQLPSVDALHKPLSDLAEVHRIRLMKLTPGGGELERHTDLVDHDSGIRDGSVARFHFPLITNDQVIFNSWSMDGLCREVNMKAGEAWYLDTRKPHRAVNNGTTERTHLVVDVVSNSDVRALLEC
jgi:Aspartyl/Asparaginyl beta-hydroxylase